MTRNINWYEKKFVTNKGIVKKKMRPNLPANNDDKIVNDDKMITQIDEEPSDNTITTQSDATLAPIYKPAEILSPFSDDDRNRWSTDYMEDTDFRDNYKFLLDRTLPLECSTQILAISRMYCIIDKLLYFVINKFKCFCVCQLRIELHL